LTWTSSKEGFCFADFLIFNSCVTKEQKSLADFYTKEIYFSNFQEAQEEPAPDYPPTDRTFPKIPTSQTRNAAGPGFWSGPFPGPVRGPGPDRDSSIGVIDITRYF
jgi:hypothetical protein